MSSDPEAKRHEKARNASHRSLEALRDARELRAAMVELGIDPELGLDQERAADAPRARMEAAKSRSWLDYVTRQLWEPMVALLIGAAAVSAALGEVTDAVAIVVIVLLNTAFGAIQESKGDRAIESLRRLVPKRARVKRSGQVTEIDADRVVLGDLLLVAAGNRLPADVRWLETQDLHTDESLLTGESVPVEKLAEGPPHPQRAPAERPELGFAGTILTRGRGVGVVVAIGEATETGRVASLLAHGLAGKTPLEIRLRQLGRQLTLAVLLFCGAAFLIGVSQGADIGPMLLTAISLAVAAVPEALPAVATVALALGSRRMAERHAQVRRLEAAEALGSVSVIASDKTGTLTLNRMTVEQVWLAGDWHPATELEDLGRIPWFGALLEALELNNDSHRNDQGWTGDPTEVALAEYASDAARETSPRSPLRTRLAELPFDSGRKRMTTVHPGELEGNLWVITKGAPEKVVSRCRSVAGWSSALDDEGRAQLLEQAAISARSGHRLLALAWKNVPADTELTEERLENDLELVALLGLIDPPRPEALAAIEACRAAGIRPVMITGDHPDTARAIGLRLGLIDRDDIVSTGHEIEQLEGEALVERVATSSIFARVSTEQKVRLLEALQHDSTLVAMTGDGVNDAPALRRANVGVAMGQRGTDVAREAADLVLLDDNFATIVAAVEEGRRVFDNIRRFVKYTLTSNIGEVVTVLGAPLFGLPIPLTPVQILWINLVTDGLPGLALGIEPAERGVMDRPPRPATESVLSRAVAVHMIFVGLWIGAISLFSQAWAIDREHSSWQTIAFCTLTFAQLIQAWALRSKGDHAASQKWLLASALVGTGLLQLAVVYMPFLQPVFGTRALGVTEMGLVLGLSSSVYLAVRLMELFQKASR